MKKNWMNNKVLKPLFLGVYTVYYTLCILYANFTLQKRTVVQSIEVNVGKGKL